ncbi:hypothetical protein LO762_22325 [Actinocorallia sp. API 0066]|uniref:hypothetical protein n=1 Tax=Actinocorallia sp. API 0066 TaxID=2896846 RepID=UPI001E4438A5|nr:hypothetical protein [Actinocorallia sp. API 0066]MCD0451911.1 hypothetical protein [Actinocorallia sp. API 0066]
MGAWDGLRVEGLVGSLGTPEELLEELVPVLAPLRPVVPQLRGGSVVTVGGSAALGTALVAGAARGEEWAAVVGVPEFGVAAAVGMGADPDRLLLADAPGGRWTEVVAALAEGVRLVLVRPPARPAPAQARRLVAVARKHGCALAVLGPWEGAHLRLTVSDASWEGLGQGHGLLRARRARVTATGRTAPGRGRSAWLFLPGPDGRVASAPTPFRRLGVVA